MKNLYFEGLEQLLNQGYHISVFNCGTDCSVVRVEKGAPRLDDEELACYVEGANVISVLNQASSEIAGKFFQKEKEVYYNETLIDQVLKLGYTLHFFKVLNNQVLAVICGGEYKNYIPIINKVTDTIETGLRDLNYFLGWFNFNDAYDFYNFVSNQSERKEAYNDLEQLSSAVMDKKNRLVRIK